MAVKPVIDLVRKIFGNKALSKTIGTRTNVITLPDSNIKTLIKNELDINKASDSQLAAFKKQAEQLIPEIPRMNDQELLTFKGNLQRYYDRMYPPKAEVFDFQTKARVPKEGIEQLETKMGIPSDVDPASPLGKIMQKVKQIEAEGKSLAEEFGMEKVLKEGLEDLTQSQSGLAKLQSEGLVRATAREIMLRDAKIPGKLSLSTEEANIITGGRGDPIDVFRKYYGEDALEQLDSLTPKFQQMTKAEDAADLATKEFNFEPKMDRDPGSFDPNEPPEFANGGRVGLANGGTYDRYMANLAEVESRASDPLTNALLASPVVEDTTDQGTETTVSPSRGSVARGNTTVQSPLGFADVMSLTNPVSTVANMVSRGLTGRTLSENVARGIQSVAASMGIGGGDGGGNPAASSDPDSQGDTGAATGGDGGGVGSSSDAGAGSTGSCGSFKDGGRVGQSSRVNLAVGTSLKYMIDFILKNARKVTKKVPSKQFLEKMAEMNPQNIVNAYEDVKKRAGIIDDPDVLMGQAPKTDLEKIRARAKKDKEGIQQLADDEQIPVRDDTLQADEILEVPEPFKSKYKDEFLAHDQIFGRRSGDNKVDAEFIAEQVAEMKGLDYDDLGYTERMDLYDKAYGYLSLLDRTKGAMKEASDIQKSGRQLNAGGGLAYLMGL